MTTLDSAGDSYHRGIELERKRREVEEAKQYKINARAGAAYSLGGIRALDTFRMDKLKTTDTNREAIGAADTFDPSKDNLYLYGPVGCGKSHISVAGVYQWAENNKKDDTNGTIWRNSKTVKPAALGREIRSAGGAEGETEIIECLRESKILVIDDLGVEKDSEFMVNILYEIIDWRYMNMPGGLIVTSNLSLGALSKKLGDDRIPSRLRQMCKGFNLAGEKDYRVSASE